MRLSVFTIVVICILLPINLFAQTEERLEIVPTDSTDMKQTVTPQGPLIELLGNVHLRQGDAEMFCKRVQWWKDTGEVIIEKDVRIYDDAKELLADKVYYYVDTKVYQATGNVVLKDSVRQTTADQIHYFKLEDKVVADGNVVMKDVENQIDIFAGHAELENDKEYALIIDNPILIKRDSTGAEELRIVGMKMELFDGGEKAVVTDSVEITQKDAVATCGIAEFYRQRNEIILRQNPVTWHKGDKLRGGTIHLFIKDDELIKAIIKDNALLTSQVDTTGNDKRMNKLTGQQITMLFEKGELNKVIVENKATSYYYVIEDGEEKGLNKIIGDKIIVSIKDRKIVNIRIESTPQLSEGVFYPPEFEPQAEGLKK